jgi:uncharacterized membrane protein
MAQSKGIFGIDRGEKVTRLEAFVDAAFAFSVTLLVISGDKIPTSVDELIQALNHVVLVQSRALEPTLRY